MRVPAVDVPEVDEDFLSGFAVIELHPDEAAKVVLNFDAEFSPTRPMLQIWCGQFSVKLSPGRFQIGPDDVRIFDLVAEVACEARDLVRALAAEQSAAAARPALAIVAG